mmetsp:Transcript_93900/g.172193  ORF Transcript_93900/g.172193 Transcript_93900/m.172193 type:complete len:446 (+) Transcript_93900:81-1418(+)
MTDARILEGEEFPTTDGLATIMLLAAICITFIILYLVNCRNSAIRSATWTMVSTAISVFIAVLTYNSASDLVKVIVDAPDHDDDHYGPPGFKMTFSRGMQLLVWWYLVVFTLYLNSNSVLHTKTYGLLSGHIMGFAGINFFGDLCLDDPFRHSPWWFLLVLVILCITFSCLFGSSILLAKCLKKGLTDEEADRWHDQSNDTGMDFLNMSTGFVWSMFFRYLITGKIPTLDGELNQTKYGGWEQIGLMGVGFALLLLTVVLSMKHVDAPEGSPKEVAFSYLNGMLTNAAAFCILFGFMWTVYTSSDIMSYCIVAICCSLVAIFYIFASAFFYHHYNVRAKILRAPFTAVALVVALSWEKLFDEMMDKFTDSIQVDGVEDDRIITLLWTGLMILIVFPAWAVYMYPKTDDDVQKAYSRELAAGPLPARAAFYDLDLANDYDPDDDEE